MERNVDGHVAWRDNICYPRVVPNFMELVQHFQTVVDSAHEGSTHVKNRDGVPWQITVRPGLFAYLWRR